MKNVGPGLTEAPELQLFRLVNPDGTFGDIGERENLIEKFPEVAKHLEADLASWMKAKDARVPYLNR